MAYFSQTDLDVRLQLSGQEYCNILEDYINSLKYGRKNTVLETKLLILDVYISLLLDYRVSPSGADMPNCITEEQAQEISDKISQLTNISFQSIGYNYVDTSTGSITPLILTVDTTKAGSASDTFILPCADIGSYSSLIDWGDGSQSTITTYNDADLSHTYSSSGVYNISIYGSLPRIYFNNSGDKLKLTDIKQWGDYSPLSLNNSFRGCSNLTGTFSDGPDLTNTSDMTQAFASCSSFNGDMSGWVMSTITNMQATFFGCSLFNRDITSWDVSNVINLGGTFFGCSIFNQDISGWDVSNCTYMFTTFYNCTSFNQDLSAWDTSSVVNMQEMFFNCTSLDQNLGIFSLQSAINLFLFADSSGLSVANIDNTLNSIAAQVPNIQNNVQLGLGNNVRTAASDAAVTTLTSPPYNWTITNP